MACLLLEIGCIYVIVMYWHAQVRTFPLISAEVQEVNLLKVQATMMAPPLEGDNMVC